MPSDNSNNDYEVGYKKPPKASQFKPGQSGNPNGRPSGTKNLKTDLQEELQEQVQINSNGQKQTVSKQRAMLMRAMEKAMKGDIRAMEFLAKLINQHLIEETTQKADIPLTPSEAEIFDQILNQYEHLLSAENTE